MTKQVKQVEMNGRTYAVHFDGEGKPTCVVTFSKGKPYRNIGVAGAIAQAAIAKATEAA